MSKLSKAQKAPAPAGVKPPKAPRRVARLVALLKVISPFPFSPFFLGVILGLAIVAAALALGGCAQVNREEVFAGCLHRDTVEVLDLRATKYPWSPTHKIVRWCDANLEAHVGMENADGDVFGLLANPLESAGTHFSWGLGL